MSYVTETLAPGEEILILGRFNWTYSVPAYSWFFISLLAPLAAAGVALAPEGGAGSVLWTTAAIAAGLGTLQLAGHIIHLITTEIAVTSSRFVYKRGLVRRTSKEVSLNKIEEINLEQSILGRMFGYGHLTLRGTGVGVIELPDIDNPVELRRAIESGKSRLRNTGQEYTGAGGTRERVEENRPAANAAAASSPPRERKTAPKTTPKTRREPTSRMMARQKTARKPGRQQPRLDDELR